MYLLMSTFLAIWTMYNVFYLDLLWASAFIIYYLLLFIYTYIYLISSNSLQIVCWVRISDERWATERARVTT